MIKFLLYCMVFAFIFYVGSFMLNIAFIFIMSVFGLISEAVKWFINLFKQEQNGL